MTVKFLFGTARISKQVFGFIIHAAYTRRERYDLVSTIWPYDNGDDNNDAE